jgi:hypothetical protein
MAIGQANQEHICGRESEFIMMVISVMQKELYQSTIHLFAL